MADPPGSGMQSPGESCLSLTFDPAHFVPDEEHIALLGNASRFVLLRRKDDLLDEGVAAVFSLASGEAELVGLCFHAGKFTPTESASWLAGRGFKPLIFVPNSGETRRS